MKGMSAGRGPTSAQTQLPRGVAKAMMLCIALLAAFTLMFGAGVGIARASDDGMEDSAGNVFATTSTLPHIVDRDLYWGGSELSASGTQIGGDAAMGGYSITLDGLSVGGNIRSGSYSLDIKDTTVENNITAGAYSIHIDSGTTAAGVYLGCEEATFAGTCDALGISAKTVTVSGTVNGDAVIAAEKVTFTPSAKVTGNVKVLSDEEPVIEDGAQVSDIDYTKTQTDEIEGLFKAATPLATLTGALFALLFLIPATILFALLLTWVSSDTVSGSGEMIARRPLAMSLSGIIGIVAIPIVFVVLCMLVVTLPIAIALVLLVSVLMLCCAAFSGASVARIVFPRMNRFASAAIGGAVIAVMLVIPVIKWIVFIACYAYMLGYFVQRIWLRISKRTPTAPGSILGAAADGGASSNPPSAPLS